MQLRDQAGSLGIGTRVKVSQEEWLPDQAPLLRANLRLRQSLFKEGLRFVAPVRQLVKTSQRNHLAHAERTFLDMLLQLLFELPETSPHPDPRGIRQDFAGLLNSRFKFRLLVGCLVEPE